ncbi:MAG: DUF3592 domain-containing protein [Bacteroidetes bacterium]|nr:DUF3592 domain-containing protein [Bacteroidota bacterium]
MNYITFVFATVIGLAAIWFSIKFIRLYLKVKKWNRVKATILSKEIFLHPKVSSSRSPYGIKVNYTYQVDNSTYNGSKVYLVELSGGQANHMKSAAENKLNKIEDIMSVYVNPRDPSQSVIFCEGVGLYIFVFFMGIVALLIGVSNIL